MPTHLAVKQAPAGRRTFVLSVDCPVSERALTVPASRPAERTEISVRGQWVPVPTLYAQGQRIVVTGTWLKVASIHDEDWLEREFTDPEVCLATLRSLPPQIRPDLFTFAQKVPATVPRYNLPVEWDSIAVASFDSFEHWWNQLPRETRKNVRRAQKRGVVIGIQPFNDDLVRDITSIQNECPIRQGRPYQHYGKTFDQVQRDHGSFLDRCDFITARFQNEMIGFLKLVYLGDIASILQLNSMVAHYDKRPANALLAKAVELCAARGISHLIYGKFNYGNKDESGLQEFKSRNAFRGLPMPRYYVPLTTWGNVCVKARLYRDLHQILPGPVIKTIVALRAKWYELTTRR
jgi:hypothetical protein